MSNTPLQILNQWMLAYTEGPELNPFPNDPDGGEMRIAASLRQVLTMLDSADKLQKPYVDKFGGEATLPVAAIRAVVRKTFETSAGQS